MERVVTFTEDPEQTGLTMRLYEGAAQDAGTDAAPRGAATPLSAADAQALVARLPALDGADAVPFALRAGPQPPPRAGATVTEPFPPEGSGGAAPTVDPGPLAILRHAPDGAVPMAPNLSLTFNQPMVALTSQEEAAAQVPVRLSPQPPGKWRWLGTRTLEFQPDPRFPMATRYTVEVPAGTPSASGSPLAQAMTWTFETPPPNLTDSWPVEGGSSRRGVSGNPQPTDPLIFLAFDQTINPQAVADRLVLTGGSTGVPARLATAEEIASKPEIAQRVKAAEPGRALVVRPTRALAQATTYRVEVPIGTPSAEGPLTTTKPQGFSFRTYGPMLSTRVHCWDQKPCPPTSPWTLEFTNPLDEDAWDSAAVTVRPEVPGLQVLPAGNTVSLYGAFTARTTYTVQVAAGIRDIFGQTLAKPATYTVQVGPAEPTFSGPQNNFVVTDPASKPGVSFFSINHRSLKVTVHEVQPEDWGAWTAWFEKYRYEDRSPGPLPGKAVASKTVPVTGSPDQLQETLVDLKPYLKGSSGNFVMKVEPSTQPKERWMRSDWLGWVSVTPLGLTVLADNQDLTAWVSRLADGAPVSGASLSLLGAKGSASTGADGLGALPLQDDLATAVIARVGDDTALLPADPYGYGGGGWIRVESLEQLRWYVFDDKNLYKPGETVHVRGWVRRLPPGEGQDLQNLDGRLKTLTWTAFSSQENPLGDGSVTLSPLGGFSFDLTLPATPNLGTARIDLSSQDDPDAWTSLSFEIQEYRTPEFEVSTSGGDGVYALGEDATVGVKAAYYAGGALPAAPVTWNVTATPGHYTPPGRADWSFGPWAPWWRWWAPPGETYNQESMSSTTDACGEALLGVHFEALNPARPMTVIAEATVTDVNRQAWSASKSFLVHPAAWYVGLKSTQLSVEAGKPFEVQTLVVDREGAEVSGATVALELRRLQWKRTGRGWQEVPEVVGTATVAQTAGKTSFTPEAGGSYAVVATIRDPAGRKNESELRFWVSGAGVEPDRGVAQEQVTVAPDKESYVVGDTAILTVQSPFFPAEGLLTLRAGGLLHTERFTMNGSVTTLKVPITEAHIPDLVVAVDVVGARERTDDQGQPRPDLAKRPAFGAGTVTLKVPPLTRALTVAVTPALSRLDPGAGTVLDLAVTDAQGQPVAGAELAVVAVDEAVLSLTGYRLPDPLDAFYMARGDGVGVSHQRQWLQLANPANVATGGLGASGMGRGGGGFGLEGSLSLDDAAVTRGGMEMDKESAPVERKKGNKGAPPPMVMAAAAPGAPMPDVSGGETSSAPIAVRSDFSAVALWAPKVTTDAAGKARVDLKLPDNLTRYRVMAVAVSGARQFGSGEADVTARLPLMVRPSAPRFLNFGDRFELPVVLQNQTDAPLVVNLAVRAQNASFLASVSSPLPDVSKGSGGVAGQRVTVPANDRVELRFPVAAAMAGEARFQFAAASGAYADAADVSLPVWTPATTEAFATYGTFDQGAVVQPVSPPKDVWAQYGGLEVTLSTTQLQALTDAFVYLLQYPYDCNEQLASRILGVAALQDVLTAFGSKEIPSADALKQILAADLDRLQKRQNADGGFAFWRRGDPSWPYLSIEVTHALVMAEQKGYAVDAGMKRSAVRYLETIERHLPAWYSKESKWYLRGYALHVLSLNGKNDLAKARALLSEGGEALPAEARGFLLPILQTGKATKEVDALKLWLNNHLVETAAGAHLTTSYDDGAYVLLNSNRAVDGIWLDALLRADPKNDVVPKLVNGLLAHRKAGRWSNTTENALVLLALDRYFRVYESVTPDLVARVWLGQDYAGDHTFKGRSTDRAQIDVPMDWLQSHGKADLTLSRQGQGRLYYRFGLRYAPLDLDPPAVDYGFTVLRTYQAVDDPQDVTQDKDGVWHVRAGARVRVRLTMVAPSRRNHVALVDPLPAGLEVLNPELKGTGALPQDPSADKNPYWWWTRTWYEHENLRDERVEAFASQLWDGVHSYTYVARATTPGDFVVPPAKAEEMYSPETFGRSAGNRVRVE